MALLEEVVRQGDTGIAKGIDPAAISIILDLVQTHQYQYPIASTIRELVSNGVDSVAEKTMALAILYGQKTVEDYFVIREGGIYQDSSFDPSYYIIKYFNRDNTVRIDVVHNPDRKDILRITDPGVGLGGRRLENYFQIGFSSKRNLKSALGKFGIGAKAPLSIDSSFTMSSAYNGIRHEFLVYSDRVVSTIPALNLETGMPNEATTFKDGSVIYGIATTARNFVTVEVETKHHQRSQVLEGVKNQLMYFKDVQLTVFEGTEKKGTPHEVAAEVIYEDSDIIVTKNNRYSKPHLVLNNVNYGYLDFIELELETKSGPVGIKMDPSEVDVNPSRESVIWSDKTRASVLAKFGKVQHIATNLVAAELSSEMDYLTWSIKCAQVLSKIDTTTSVLSAMRGLIDTTQIKPVFPGNAAYVWEFSNLKQFAQYRLVKLDKGVKSKPKREPTNWAEINLTGDLYVQQAGGYSAAFDAYLYETCRGDVYILIKPDEELLDRNDMFVEDLLAFIARSELIDASPLLHDYSLTLIPDGYGKEAELEDQIDKEKAKQDGISAATLRKMNGVVTFKVAQIHQYSEKGMSRPVTLLSEQAQISAIPDWEGQIVYGSMEDRPMIELVANLLRYLGRVQHNVCWDKEITLIQIAKDNLRYFSHANIIHVKDWFYRLEGGHLTTHPYLVGINTVRKLKELKVENSSMSNMAFLNNFKEIDPDLSTQYHQICDYIYCNAESVVMKHEKYGRNAGMQNVKVPDLDRDLTNFLDHLATFQDLPPETTEDQRKALSLEFFGTDAVTSTYGYEKSEVDKLQDLLERTSPYRIMCESIELLAHNNMPLSSDLEMEIKAFIAYKLGK